MGNLDKLLSNVFDGNIHTIFNIAWRMATYVVEFLRWPRDIQFARFAGNSYNALFRRRRRDLWGLTILERYIETNVECRGINCNIGFGRKRNPVSVSNRINARFGGESSLL